jgi:hypothetical protein
MFLITMIGGNAPLLVPLARSLVVVKPAYLSVDFTAQSADSSSSPYELEVDAIIKNDADELQYALVYVLGALYLCSSIGYVLSAYGMLNQNIDTDADQDSIKKKSTRSSYG